MEYDNGQETDALDADELGQDGEDQYIETDDEGQGQDEEELLNEGEGETEDQEDEPEEKTTVEVEFKAADGETQKAEVAFEDLPELLAARSKLESYTAEQRRMQDTIRQQEQQIALLNDKKIVGEYVLNNEFLSPIVEATVKGANQLEIIQALRAYFDTVEAEMENNPPDPAQQKMADIEQRQARLEKEHEERVRQQQYRENEAHNNSVLGAALEKLGLEYDPKRDDEVIANVAKRLGLSNDIKLDPVQAEFLYTVAQRENPNVLKKKGAPAPKSNPQQPVKTATKVTRQPPPRVVPAGGGGKARTTETGAPVDPEAERKRRIAAL